MLVCPYVIHGPGSYIISGPDIDSPGQNLDEDCRQHEAGAESHKIFEEPLAI
jgi:hypothetical protein